jgi:tetratricopeptide (TPR) repeat protein
MFPMWKTTAFLIIVLAAAATAYEKPEIEKADIDPEDLARFKEAYTFYLDGVGFEKEGSWVSASQAYRKAVEIYHNYPDALYGLGRMALRLGRLDEAEDALREALTLKPELHRAHTELGSVHYRRGDYNKAALEYKDALKHDPDDAVARYNLGNAYRNLDKPKDALEEYEKVLEREPGYVDCYYNMALAYEDLGKVEEAIAAYDKFIEVAGDDPGQQEWVNRAKEYKQSLREGEKGE